MVFQPQVADAPKGTPSTEDFPEPSPTKHVATVEQAEVCADCLSPLEEEFCPSCSRRGTDELSVSSNPFGEIIPSRSDFKRILGRVPSRREHNYFRSLYVDDEGRVIHERTRTMVERLQLDGRAMTSLIERVAVTAKKLRKTTRLSVTEAVISAMAAEAPHLGISLPELARRIGEVHPDIARVAPLRISIRCDDVSAAKVLIRGNERSFTHYRDGLIFVLKVRLYAFDNAATLVFRNARIANVPDRRAELIDGQTVRLKIDQRKSFELFKMLKKSMVDEGISKGEAGLRAFQRRFSLARLPLTESLARESGSLFTLQSLFSGYLDQRLRDTMGRSPERVAQDSLLEAGRDAFERMTLEKKHGVLLLAGKLGIGLNDLSGTVVRSELSAWLAR